MSSTLKLLTKNFSELVCIHTSFYVNFRTSITPYLDVTKRLYKALVNAKKDPNADVDQSARAVVASDVYAVSGVVFAGAGDGDGDGDGDGGLFPRARNRQNFCYLCVDPWKRHVTVWYHGFRAYW